MQWGPVHPNIPAHLVAKQLLAPRQPEMRSSSGIDKTGAGEGIRTPDPNLGKVKIDSLRLLPQGSGSFLAVDANTFSEALIGSGRS